MAKVSLISSGGGDSTRQKDSKGMVEDLKKTEYISTNALTWTKFCMYVLEQVGFRLSES